LQGEIEAQNQNLHAFLSCFLSPQLFPFLSSPVILAAVYFSQSPIASPAKFDRRRGKLLSLFFHGILCIQFIIFYETAIAERNVLLLFIFRKFGGFGTPN